VRLFATKITENGVVTEAHDDAQRAFLIDLTGSGRVLLSGGQAPRRSRGLAPHRAEAEQDARILVAPCAVASRTTFGLSELVVMDGTAPAAEEVTPV
jgi:hypothetical protein